MGKVAERRARTRDAIVACALEVIGEQGAAGLTLGEVARRLGMRTPSLYGYFDSRAALCDEIFARGWTALGAAGRPMPSAERPLAEVVAEGMGSFVAWALEHPAYAQLMFWRPIAGWRPSPEAFEPAVAVMADTTVALARAQALGQLDAAYDPAELAEVIAALVAGIVSQQLSNEPGVPMADGRTARHLDAFVSMFVAHYSHRSQP